MRICMDVQVHVGVRNVGVCRCMVMRVSVYRHAIRMAEFRVRVRVTLR